MMKLIVSPSVAISIILITPYGPDRLATGVGRVSSAGRRASLPPGRRRRERVAATGGRVAEGRNSY